MIEALNQFVDKKKANSEFLSLGNGESIKVANLREVKCVKKVGMSGEEKDAIRLVVDVQTPEGLRTKKFDNTSNSFAKELQAHEVQIGSSFNLTRTGTGLQTRYTLSEVVNPTV